MLNCVSQMATQVPKGGNSVRFVSRSLPGFSSSPCTKRFSRISDTWHSVWSFNKISYLAWDYNAILCYFPWCKHLVHLGGQPLYSRWGRILVLFNWFYSITDEHYWSFGVIHSITDVEMAEYWANIPCWGNLSAYRVSDLDHSTASNKEKTIWDILLHTPSLHGFPIVLLVSCRRSALLHRLPWNISVWTRQAT